MNKPIILEYNEPERFAWSRETFPDATADGSWAHFLEEIDEIYQKRDKGEEYLSEAADAQMMFWDFLQRDGVDIEQLFVAMHRKFQINKNRTWEKNNLGYYKHREDGTV